MDKSVLPIVPIECLSFEERVNSFKTKRRFWPYQDPKKSHCTPNEMAIAGFIWHQTPVEYRTVKCFVCDIVIHTNDLRPEVDPWLLHKKKNPNCPYIEMGKRTDPEDYKFAEIQKLVILKQKEAFAVDYVTHEQIVKAKIQQLVQLEKEEKADSEEQIN